MPLNAGWVGEHTSIATDTNNKVHISYFDRSNGALKYAINSEPEPDTTSPTIISISPVDSATNVAVSTTITAVFNESMNASTINNTTFTVNGITGTVTYSGTQATFTPSNNLANNTTYTVTITTGVKDITGNAMSQNKTWKFSTIAEEANGESNINSGGKKKGCLISTITQNTKLNEYQNVLTELRDKYFIYKISPLFSGIFHSFLNL